MKLLRAIWRWFCELFRRQQKPYLVVISEDLPDGLRERTLYLVGTDPHFWMAAMLCPCGCGETIELNLAPPARPRWSVRRNPDQTVTVHPSIWRSRGCTSHFWLRGGLITWCPAFTGKAGSDTPLPELDGDS